MTELWRKIERHLPGAEKRATIRAQRNGFTAEYVRIARESGIDLEGVPTQEARAKAAETMRRLGLGGSGRDGDSMFNDYDVDRS